MEKQPEEITLCQLDCVLMPQGEIICNGKTIGWFKDFSPHLRNAKTQDDLVDACRSVVKKLGGMSYQQEIFDKCQQALKQAKGE